MYQFLWIYLEDLKLLTELVLQLELIMDANYSLLKKIFGMKLVKFVDFDSLGFHSSWLEEKAIGELFLHNPSLHPLTLILLRPLNLRNRAKERIKDLPII